VTSATPSDRAHAAAMALSSRANASAAGKRSAGRFSSARSTAASSAGGMGCAARADGGSGRSVTLALSSSHGSVMWAYGPRPTISV
jgi:hypothetical protein